MHHKILPFTFDDLKAWYNGYHTPGPGGIKLLNLWSVAQALIGKRLGSHWVVSGQPTLPLSLFPVVFRAGYDRVIEDRIMYISDFGGVVSEGKEHIVPFYLS
jgi:hypothetical protein